MQISLKNISKIEKANIEINGITVIAGENNTGKSTVGKALWSIFNSFYNIDDEIRKERKEIINEKLNNNLKEVDLFNIFFENTRLGSLEKRVKISQIAENIIKLWEENRIENIKIEDIKNIILENLGENIEKNFDSIKALAEEIYDILSLDDNYIIRTHFQDILLSEFNNQVNSLYNKEDGEIELTVANKKIVAKINSQKVKELKSESLIKLQTKAIYIDDPNVIERVPTISFSKNHREDLEELLFTETKKNLIENALLERKLEKINEKLEQIFNNEMIFNFKEGKVKIKNISEDMDIRNLSTGLKTFVILKNLISNGALEKRGTLILDEPEIHLHPEWQLRFAEIIVLLQKELDLHILLATHSPYFLRALQVFAGNYGIADKCKYYLAENQENYSIISDVTDQIDLIYKKLAKPLQKLEDLMYEEY